MGTDYLPATLTESQRSAILHAGSPLRIIAGPGSGKTEVIAWRVAHLLRSGQAKPESLLVLTFANKAAMELRDRIQAKVPEVNVELMQVSTFHAFCADLLRKYRPLTRMPRGFRILDEADQLLFIYANRKALGLGEIAKSRPGEFYANVIHCFGVATDELVEPERMVAWCEKCKGKCAQDEEDLWNERETVAQAYNLYRNLLLRSEMVDFGHLQLLALQLFEEHPEVVAAERALYSHILVDEYQDTNAAQERLLSLLAGDLRSLTVVGDDDQSIYRFRGATVGNLIGFEKRYAGATKIELGQNFRSREQIVEHSRSVIRHNPARYIKDLLSMRGRGCDVVLVYERSAREEAQAVVQLLGRQKRAGHVRRWGDVAILLRSVRSHARPYLEALLAAGVPYHVRGDASFFQRAEISQLYDLLNFLGAPKPWGDRFLRHPLVGLSEATIRALEKYNGSLSDLEGAEGLRKIGVKNSTDRTKVMDLLELKRKVQAKSHSSLLEVVYRLLAITGCVSRVEKAGDADALANLGLFTQYVSRWDECGPTRNFYPFQEYLQLLREGGLDPIVKLGDNVVQVMTIHQAKGQGFPIVVLGAAMEGRLPISARRQRYEIPPELRASGPPEVDDPHTVDERKLFYVAATRARDLLIVGTADVVEKRGSGPSRFVKEMFGEDLRAASDHGRAYLEAVESHSLARQEPKARQSFGSLAFYLQCPMRYKFAEVYGFSMPWVEPVDFGANVHRALEALHQRILRGERVTEDDVPAAVEETWMPGRRREAQAEAKLKEAATRYVRGYVHSAGPDLTRVLRSETSFAMDLQNRVLGGKIDLIRSYGDQGDVEIVDFKTSNSAPLSEGRIDLQLDLYALGTERSMGLRVAGETAHFLADGVAPTVEWTPEREEHARAELTLILETIDRGDFGPKTEYCARCDEFNAICPYAPTRKGGKAK